MARDIPKIALPDGFQLNQVKSLPNLRKTLPLDATPPLGALEHFKGTFAGNGFNLIFRPQNPATPTPLPKPGKGLSDNILELNLTQETLTFSAPLGSVPNRGFAQGDIFLNGVPYVQSIDDVTEGEPVAIHFEPGIWLAVPATTTPAVGETLVRMASIPHGTTINLQGTSTGPVAGPPVIPPVDPTPFGLNNFNPLRMLSQDVTRDDTFRIPQDLAPFVANGTITQAILDDPNTVLRQAIAGQKIVETVTIHVASKPDVPAAGNIPPVGGGADNIAFLEGAGVPNADVPSLQSTTPPGRGVAGVKSTFWIETIEHVITLPPFPVGHGPITIPADIPVVPGQPRPHFKLLPPTKRLRRPKKIKLRTLQIQYSQTVLLNFAPLSWPHVSVATLVPTGPIVVPPHAWGGS